jgi:hypothetical protein
MIFITKEPMIKMQLYEYKNENVIEFYMKQLCDMKFQFCINECHGVYFEFQVLVDHNLT